MKKSLWQHEMELETLIEVYKKMVASYDNKATIDKQWQLILDKQTYIDKHFTLKTQLS